MNGRVCDALVQLGCYQHKHIKWMNSSPTYIRLSLEVTCLMYMYAGENTDIQQYSSEPMSEYHTSSKSRHPPNVTACFSQLISIDLYICVRTHIACMHVYIRTLLLKLCARVRVNLCGHHPRNLAALKLSLRQTESSNKLSSQWDFKDVQYAQYRVNLHIKILL